MRFISIIIILLVFVSCKNTKEETAKEVSKNALISLFVAPDSIEKIVLTKPLPVFIRSEEEVENQTPLFVDSLNNKWTDNREEINCFLDNFPKRISDIPIESIVTGCCVNYYEFHLITAKREFVFTIDDRNPNLVGIEGGYIPVKGFNIEQLTNCISKTVIIQEKIVESKSDTNLTNDFSKNYGFRSRYFIGEEEKMTVGRYEFK